MVRIGLVLAGSGAPAVHPDVGAPHTVPHPHHPGMRVDPAGATREAAEQPGGERDHELGVPGGSGRDVHDVPVGELVQLVLLGHLPGEEVLDGESRLEVPCGHGASLRLGCGDLPMVPRTRAAGGPTLVVDDRVESVGGGT